MINLFLENHTTLEWCQSHASETNLDWFSVGNLKDNSKFMFVRSLFFLNRLVIIFIMFVENWFVSHYNISKLSWFEISSPIECINIKKIPKLTEVQCWKSVCQWYLFPLLLREMVLLDRPKVPFRPWEIRILEGKNLTWSSEGSLNDQLRSVPPIFLTVMITLLGCTGSLGGKCPKSQSNDFNYFWRF